jgi:hypothetical protein
MAEASRNRPGKVVQHERLMPDGMMLKATGRGRELSVLDPGVITVATTIRGSHQSGRQE